MPNDWTAGRQANSITPTRTREPTMRKWIPAVLALVALSLVLGCEPQDRRPGLWLTGTPREFPSDWSFTDAIPEIAIQVHTPYLLPHSVTIWCAEVNGDLYVAAANPEDKNWPGWVREVPEVRLKVGDDVYDVTLDELTEPERIAPVQRAYAEKYHLDGQGSEGTSSVRYWAVEPPLDTD